MPPKLFGQLLRMDFPELATRSRQEAFKWIEAIRPRARIRRAERGDEALRDFNSNYHDIFFAGAVDARALAAHASPIVAAADRLLSGHFDLLGYSDLNFGDPLDWHFDPVSGRRAPRRHWTSIDGEDYAAIGDPKVIGELNRHQWLVTLAQAYKLTREEGYAVAVMRYLQSWLRENPVGIGINWTSSLELALRLIAWSWALVLIAESRAMNGARFAALLESVRAQAVHVERYMSHYFSPNTHLTGEALGLFYAGVLFTQLKSASRWRSVGLRVLVQEIERQVLPDGVYFERTTCYQRYTIETYLHLMILARRLGIELPPSVEQRVRAMLDFILPMRHADGCVPSIGDADGGRLLPLSHTEPGDFGPCFSTAAVLFNDATYAWAAGELSAETVWLLGSDAIDSFEALQPEPP
ncbi:MAG TPA: heparinase II/III family protein, partial [Thermoanaerobaculia bacterium]|nr:heparinase II/III family protein [Thermoanaerobaculia bacterium]